MLDDLKYRRVTVMGLGRFGGGVGVTRWLAAQGARVVVTDLDPAEKLRQSIDAIADLIAQEKAELRLGGHATSDFTNCELVVANPAVPKPWQNEFINAAMEAGVPVTTEIRLLTDRLNRQRVIGVTGSAGKSTTAAMIHHILINAGLRAHLGGNIGGSLLNQLDQIQSDDWIVLEFSSAMLYWLGEGAGAPKSKIQSPKSESKIRRGEIQNLRLFAGWSPHVGLITNIEPNHLDWHGSFEHYRECKLNIHRFMVNGDVAMHGSELGPSDGAAIPLLVIGAHNQVNARMACRVVAEAAGLEFDRSAELLADFPGLPHRLQFVAAHDGLRFYNDSKSTTPQATALAVDAFDDPKQVHLIAGGYDKGSDLRPIADLGARIAGLYTIGTTGPGLADAARGFALHCESLEQAVERAMVRMNSGDSLLLSPGCASWDQFTNYEQRGEAFVKLVHDFMRASSPAR